YVNALNLCSLGLGPVIGGGACSNVTPITPAGSAFMRSALAPAAFDPVAMVGCLSGAPGSVGQTAAKDIMDYYNQTSTYLNDLLGGDVSGAYQALLAVPPVDGFNEIR